MYLAIDILMFLITRYCSTLFKVCAPYHLSKRKNYLNSEIHLASIFQVKGMEGNIRNRRYLSDSYYKGNCQNAVIENSEK